MIGPRASVADAWCQPAGFRRRAAVPIALAPGRKHLLVAFTRFFVKIEDAGIAPASAAFVVVGAYRRNRGRIIRRRTLVDRSSVTSRRSFGWRQFCSPRSHELCPIPRGA